MDELAGSRVERPGAEPGVAQPRFACQPWIAAPVARIVRRRVAAEEDDLLVVRIMDDAVHARRRRPIE
jgi:hypothetical protein